MTVKQLIERLQQENPNAPVYVPKRNEDFPEYHESASLENLELSPIDSDESEVVALVLSN